MTIREDDVLIPVGGLLDILELQLPGGRPMTARDFLRGHAVRGFDAGQQAQAQQQ